MEELWNLIQAYCRLFLFFFFEWLSQLYFFVYWLIAKHSLPPNTKNKATQNNWLWLLSIHTYRWFQEYLNGFWCLVVFSWKRLEYPQVIWREINQCHYKMKPRGRSMMRPRSVTIMWLYSVNYLTEYCKGCCDDSCLWPHKGHCSVVFAVPYGISRCQHFIKKREKKSRLYLPSNMLKKFYSEHIIIKNSNKIEGRNWVNGNVHNFWWFGKILFL